MSAQSQTQVDSVVDPLHEKFLQNLRRAEEQLRLWQVAKKKALPFINQMILLSDHYSIDSTDVNFSISGDKQKFLKLVRLHRRFGLRPMMPQAGATSATWRVNIGGQNVYVYFSSTVCRRVQVGTRLEEVPVYETRCEDIAPSQEDVAQLEQETQRITEVPF